MNRKTSLSVILPVYNEKDNIKEVISQALDMLPALTDEFEIIVVDDGSVDGTDSVLDELAKRDSRIKIIHHRRNSGYGGAIKSGFRSASYPWLFFMDADGQFRISDIETLLQYIDTFDIVTGYRVIRKDSPWRIIIGMIYTRLINLLFGLNMKDINCGFKLLKAEIWNSINVDSGGGVFVAEMMVEAIRRGYSFKEVGVRHFRRIHGKPHGISIKIFIRACFELLNLIWKINTQKNECVKREKDIVA